MCTLTKHIDRTTALAYAQHWLDFQHQRMRGIKRAEAEGKFGRPKVKVNPTLLIRFASSDGTTKQHIAKSCGISMATLYRRIKEKCSKKGGTVIDA